MLAIGTKLSLGLPLASRCLLECGVYPLPAGCTVLSPHLDELHMYELYSAVILEPCNLQLCSVLQAGDHPKLVPGKRVAQL